MGSPSGPGASAATSTMSEIVAYGTARVIEWTDTRPDTAGDPASGAQAYAQA